MTILRMLVRWSAVLFSVVLFSAIIAFRSGAWEPWHADALTPGTASPFVVNNQQPLESKPRPIHTFPQSTNGKQPRRHRMRDRDDTAQTVESQVTDSASLQVPLNRPPIPRNIRRETQPRNRSNAAGISSIDSRRPDATSRPAQQPPRAPSRREIMGGSKSSAALLPGDIERMQRQQ